jgi:hypothetical protein
MLNLLKDFRHQFFPSVWPYNFGWIQSAPNGRESTALPRGGRTTAQQAICERFGRNAADTLLAKASALREQIVRIRPEAEPLGIRLRPVSRR